MKKSVKNFGLYWIIVIVLIIAWLFDFPSWVRENIGLVTTVMLGSIIGGLWWIADKLKEIERLISDLSNRE